MRLQQAKDREITELVRCPLRRRPLFLPPSLRLEIGAAKPHLCSWLDRVVQINTPLNVPSFKASTKSTGCEVPTRFTMIGVSGLIRRRLWGADGEHRRAERQAAGPDEGAGAADPVRPAPSSRHRGGAATPCVLRTSSDCGQDMAHASPASLPVGTVRSETARAQRTSDQAMAIRGMWSGRAHAIECSPQSRFTLTTGGDPTYRCLAKKVPETVVAAFASYYYM